MTRRLARAALGVVLLAGALVGCRGGSSPGPGEARLTAISGRVEVSKAGGPWRPAAPGVLGTGDRVRVRAGRAVMVLPGEGRLELRRGSLVRVARAPELVAGDLLVLPARREVTVAAASARTVAGDGSAVRMRRGLAVEVGLYRGGATLSSAGRSLAVPALRQATVSAPGLVPDRAGPLMLQRSDEWDRRFLLDAIVLGDELEQFSRGLTSQLPATSARGRELLTTLLPALARERSLDAVLDAVAALPPGEQVVGAAITLAGRKHAFADRWRAVFGFREEGASWGLVAFDQGVRQRPVATVEEALGRLVRRPDLVAAPAPPVPPRAGNGPANGPGSGPASPPGTSPPVTPTTAPPPPTTTTTQPPPVTVPPLLPPPEGDGGLLGDVVDPLVEAVGGLIGGLLGQPSPPGGGSG